MPRNFLPTILAAALLTQATPSVALETVPLPPSGQQGLDMIMVDAEAMPVEPELARDIPEVQDESWSGAAIDLLKPVHHLYTDLRRQLVRYQDRWGALPQVRIAAREAVMAKGSADPRVPALRERLGLPRAGAFDAALETKLAEYQQAHGLPADGKAGSDTIASLNRGAAHYERLILLNMERARRLPAAEAAGRYILVDAGSARLWMYENGRAVDSMKVIVGTAQSATPMMAALLRYASVNPYWNVPPDLVAKSIAPRVLAEGVGYLKTKRYEVLDSWEDDARVVDPASVDWRAVADKQHELRVRQLPGESNFMGDIKFMMPNIYGIYLHDTPGKILFNEDDRWLSNGCIRLEDARRLARWVFGAMPQGRSPDREEDAAIAQPVPVYVTYLTVGADAQGLSFRPDRYGRDAAPLTRFADRGDGMVDAVALAPGKPTALAARPAPAKPAATSPGKKGASPAVKPKPAKVAAAAPDEKGASPALKSKPAKGAAAAPGKKSAAVTPPAKAAPASPGKKAAPTAKLAAAKTPPAAKPAPAKPAGLAAGKTAPPASAAPAKTARTPAR
ncbi:MAG: L,D-transpeptidase family protein [Novosphingobium sp.]